MPLTQGVTLGGEPAGKKKAQSTHVKVGWASTRGKHSTTKKLPPKAVIQAFSFPCIHGSAGECHSARSYVPRLADETIGWGIRLWFPDASGVRCTAVFSVQTLARQYPPLANS